MREWRDGAGNAAGETWLDWMPHALRDVPPDACITRDELLARMATRGVSICPRTLKIMERQRLIPRPVRQRRDGATRALYPPWIVDIAIIAHRDRHRRIAVPTARAHARATVARLFGLAPLRAEDV